MRDHDEILNDLREKLEAIDTDELHKHREARIAYSEARDLLAEAAKYRRMASYIKEDNDLRESDDLGKAYEKIAYEFENAAEIRRHRGDGYLYTLANTSRTVTVQVKD